MANEKITGDMSIITMVKTMSNGNPGAFSVLMKMLSKPTGLLDILSLDSMDIRGEKIWLLFNDCCNQDMNKFDKTLKVLRCGGFTHEEIQSNLSLIRAIPFMDDSIVLDDDTFNDDTKFKQYLEDNRNIVVAKINEMTEKSRSLKKQNNI